MNFIYTTTTIQEKRLSIRENLFKLSSNIKSHKITKLSTQDLLILFGLYDHFFLENHFLTHYKHIQLNFSWSKRLTKAAGKTIFYRKRSAAGIEKSYEIRMATDFFFEYEKVSREVSVCGIATIDAVEALQIVFEHEICHLIEYVQTDNSSCHQKAFHSLAGNLFGHTEFTHQLPSKQEIAATHYGFQVGQIVKFSFEGKILTGTLYKINKRAVVMVASIKGTFIDTNGKRYEKYYVPLATLQQN